MSNFRAFCCFQFCCLFFSSTWKMFFCAWIKLFCGVFTRSHFFENFDIHIYIILIYIIYIYIYIFDIIYIYIYIYIHQANTCSKLVAESQDWCSGTFFVGFKKIQYFNLLLLQLTLNKQLLPRFSDFFPQLSSRHLLVPSQQKKSPEQRNKSVQKRQQNDLNDVVLVSLLLTLNRFHTLSWCFHS